MALGKTSGSRGRMAGRAPLLAAAVILATAWAAQGQVKEVYTGRVLDANPQVGAGGSNQPVPGYVPVNGNAIVSGNVSGLAYFHAPVVSSNPYAFEESLPSAALGNFERQSAPLNYTSGQGTTQTYYFNPSSQTAGLAYDGKIAVAAPTGNGFDTTLTYYGKTSEAAAGSSYELPKIQSLGNPLQPLPLGEQVPAYNYESLATPGDYGSGQLSALYAAQPLNVNGNESPDRYATQAQRASTNSADQTQLNGSTGAGKAPTGEQLVDENGEPIVAGSDQQVESRVRGVSGQKPLDQRIGPNGQTGENTQPSADVYDQLMSELATNMARTSAQPGTPTAQHANGTAVKINPLTGQPVPANGTESGTGSGTAGGAAGTGGTAAGGTGPQYQSTDPAAPNYRPTSMLPSANQTNGLESQATLQAGRALPALSTLAGTGRSEFHATMARAEQQLRAGLYLRAADTYQGALQIEPNNALALVGRAHAELGAGLVESAAYDLKFLWTRKPELIAVHYDLTAFLPKQRIDFVRKDLSGLAKQGVPAASFLLAYVDYQLGETRDLISALNYWKQRQPDPWQDILTKAWIDQPGPAPAGH